MSIDSTLVYTECGRKTGVRKTLAAAAAATTTTTTSSSSSSSSSIIIIIIVIITITMRYRKTSGELPTMPASSNLLSLLLNGTGVLPRPYDEGSVSHCGVTGYIARPSVYPNDSGEVLRNLRRAANNASLIELAIAVAQPEPTCPSILAIVNAQGLLKALLQSHWSSLAA
ncbi:uncharacterized protein BO95DRAFT_464473 [Aspergillus brunneoviolaceus CBS 621.78]|uniref:Uncharacterized protein n=1 Tax=Aspergillus brunneoviolaceus CBS 621.78 TaxID=1450534 RepID=A0ACD1G6M0_9EURO|nr:hypothetical protein BO95DRAFT_464473 [Aspergillus brunneoviolaceus CBS 621.78]RAH44921.1 hypothetical protein BO95DRAFT_464473 [Aspergillus brunneoviolaceus CBS 621.78]